MKIIFSSQAWEEYLYWQKTDRQILERINLLIKNISRKSYTGIIINNHREKERPVSCLVLPLPSAHVAQQEFLMAAQQLQE